MTQEHFRMIFFVFRWMYLGSKNELTFHLPHIATGTVASNEYQLESAGVHTLRKSLIECTPEVSVSKNKYILYTLFYFNL